jgi:hypothetical protein
MFGLCRQFFRSSVSIILLWVALLLPTLHFHPFFAHEHGDHEVHGHAVVHADFLAVAVGHDHDTTADIHNVSGHDQSEPSYQVNFLSLVSRAGAFLLNASQTHWIFFFFEASQSFRPSVYSWTFKPDHPPPIAIFDFEPGFPRSPPRSV